MIINNYLKANLLKTFMLFKKVKKCDDVSKFFKYYKAE